MPQLAPVGQKAYTVKQWIQLLAGPVLWSVHFLASYLLVEAFCQLGWNFQLLGAPGLVVLLVTITVLALAGTIYFAFRSYHAWKETNRDQNLWDEFRQTSRWSENAGEFMYFSGFLLSVLFAATIVVVGLPVFFLRPCG